jgi:hypothetical protein
MEGIETGGVRPQGESRVGALEIKDSSSRQPQASDGAASRGDSVTLDNFVQRLVDRLQTFFASNKMAKDQFAQTVTELSMRANVKQTFEGAVATTGGAKLGAYVKRSSEVNIQIEMRVSQAQQVVEAQATAVESNPFGPEATAQRIADFALSFFPMFAKQNGDKELDQQLSDYQKMVEDAIGKGFSEAMSILGDLPDEISRQIQETRDLVGQKLADFFNYAKNDPEKTKTAAYSGDWKAYVQDVYAQLRESKASGTDDGSVKIAPPEPGEWR